MKSIGMINLIGEQPIPNLLPLLYFSGQQQLSLAVLLHTSQTKNVAERLRELLQDQMAVDLVEVTAYDIPKIYDKIHQSIRAHSQKVDEWIFNITGGTKAMSLAAYQVAAGLGALFVYLQSEGRQELLHQYTTHGGQIVMVASPIQIPALITLDHYLRAHVGRYQEKSNPKQSRSSLGLAFEQAIAQALVGVVDEVKRGVRIGGALELDLVVRRGNRVGVIQAKTGRKAGTKEGLDQLNAACGREFLGIYTAKILVINKSWGKTQENLRELAGAWGIRVVELTSFKDNSRILPQEDQDRLRDQVREALG